MLAATRTRTSRKQGAEAIAPPHRLHDTLQPLTVRPALVCLATPPNGGSVYTARTQGVTTSRQAPHHHTAAPFHAPVYVVGVILLVEGVGSGDTVAIVIP